MFLTPKPKTEANNDEYPTISIIQLLENFRPRMRVEVFETITPLITGLFVGAAEHGTVRSSVFANDARAWLSSLFSSAPRGRSEGYFVSPGVQ
jgi:hypothetical protein